MTEKFSKEIAWLKRDKYGDDEVQLRAHLKSDFKRLKAGEPIDYIIGWREFLGCKIDLSYKPLIPRAETEFWVEQAIKKLNEVGVRSRTSRSQVRLRRPLRVLDLFAGSGCVGLAILKHVPNVQVTFADLYPVNRRIIKTNVFSNITGKFDLIFANPPYVPAQKSKVQKSVKDWEPKKALCAGADGLTIIKKFLKQAQDHLNSNGRIYLEFGHGQKTKIGRLIKQFDYAHCRFHRDQFGHWRWVAIS